MKKHAVLVGINGYKRLGQLRYARQDAEAVADALKRCYGFSDDEITLMTDESKNAPEDRYAIQEALSPDFYANDLELFVFGFFGHGIWDGDQRYLCPMNVRDNILTDTALPLKVVQESLSHIRAKNICLILDCCQNEVSTEGRSAAQAMSEGEETSLDLLARDVVLKLKKKTVDPDYNPTVVVLNSCKKGERAFESVERRHGLFTAELLEGMEKRCKSTSELCEYVRDNVPKALRTSGVHQTPYYTCAGGSDIHLPVVKKGFDVFLSYRREGGAMAAKLLQTQLENRNLRVFLDVNESMAGGSFDEALLTRIEESACFVPILSSGCFSRPDAMSDEDWVYREFLHAVRKHKPIVPVFASGFAWEREKLPERVEWLRKVDGIEYHPIYVEGFLNRLVNAVRQPGKLNYEAILEQMIAPYRAPDVDVVVPPVSGKSSKTMEELREEFYRQFRAEEEEKARVEEARRLALEQVEAEKRAAAELAKKQQVSPAPSDSGDVSIPEGRRVHISTSSELHNALKNKKNAVLMLVAGTYDLSENYFISGKNLSIYGNPTDPGSVKIRFTEGEYWNFRKGSRGSIIGVDVVGKYGVFIRDSGTSMTLRNCVLHDCGDGIFLCEGARADVRDCEIRNCKDWGISVHKSGTTLQAENCRISGNGSDGIYVQEGHADVSNCEIRDNKDTGVYCLYGATGTFCGNRLSGNRNGNWKIDDDSPGVTRTGNTPNE